MRTVVGMGPTLHKVHSMQYQKYVHPLLLVSLLGLTGCSSHPPDMQAMLVNLNNSLPDIWRLATSIGYVMGFLFTFKAMYYLKVYGEARTMMQTQSSMKVPCAYLFAAVALIYMPTMFQSLMLSSFGYESPIKYDVQEIQGISATSMHALIYLVQTVGVIAFIRGWFHLAKNTEQGAHGNFGKALAHLIGGVLAINIVGTKEMLWNTFGFS